MGLQNQQRHPLTPLRTLENAADALARLDQLLSVAPRAFGNGARAAAVAALSRDDSKATLELVVAAAAGSVELPSEARRWRDFIDEEERRARGGAPITLNRLKRAGFPPGEPIDSDESALIEALGARASGTDRPAALLRAVAVGAHIDDPAWADAVAALLLCGEGRMDRVWMLPFARIDMGVRHTAVESWRTGEEAPWQGLALEALAVAARSLRVRVERSLATLPAEDGRLDTLGRAAITARRALAVLRDELATTIPALADMLGISRPAAGDALGRLVELGAAVELTGRQRGRAFGCAAALAAVS